MIPALQTKRPSGRFIFVHGRLQPFRPFIAFPLHVLPYHYNVMSLLCVFTAFRGSIPQACYFSLQSLIAVFRSCQGTALLAVGKSSSPCLRAYFPHPPCPDRPPISWAEKIINLPIQKLPEGKQTKFINFKIVVL